MLILDGYNWAFSDDWDGGDADEMSLEEARRRVCATLNRWIEAKGERVICVFDGADRFNRERVGLVEVWFTDAKRSADDEIVHAVRGVPRPREARTVTNDRELERRVQDEGGVVWSTGDFAAALRELFRAPVVNDEESAAAEKPAMETDVDGWVQAFEDAPPRDGDE